MAVTNLAILKKKFTSKDCDLVAQFDPDWYLSQYPDVAAAGMDPWQHYVQFGKAEGRLPRQNRALAWEHHLWRGADDVMLPRLAGLLSSEDANPEEQLHARWSMARWFAYKQQWQAVAQQLSENGELLGFEEVGPGPGLLAVDAHTKLAKTAREQSAALKQIMARLKAKFPDCGDVLLAQSNILSLQRSTDQKRLALLNQVFQKAGLASVKLKPARTRLSLDNLVGVPSKRSVPRQLAGHVAALSGKSSKATTSITALNQPKRLSKRSRQVVESEAGVGVDAREGAKSSANMRAPVPLVSVIVPMYNAQDSIGTALQSLFEQTWRPLEIIVVDDASSDDSLAVVERMAEQCPDGVTLQLLRQQKNAGAYVARNQGLKVARGDFITTHDSDDWSHPEKITRQIEALLSDPRKVGCLSHWVRVTTDLKFSHWFQESAGWTYRNMSSLMFRRAVFDSHGCWDEVKVNGDTEFHERVLAVFGAHSVADVLPGVPLSFGRSGEKSLSQTSSTHLVTQFLGVRHDYMANARRWHQSAKQASDLRLEPASKIRPFPAPASICRPYSKVWFYHPLDEIQASGLFDAGWYLRTNIDLQQHTIDALNHYWETGALEGRDPSPNFSSSGYLASYPDAVKSGLNPLLHYIRVGQLKGYNPLPVFKGRVRRKKNKPTVMLVGHAAGETLYGAERSLIDVSKAIDHLGFNLVVVLPSAINPEYVQTLSSLSNAVAILPFGWWQSDKGAEAVTVEHFTNVIKKYRVDLVHVNTLVLDEPLVAARALGIPSLIHVRELPEYDEALRKDLNASALQLRQRLMAVADGVIVNSTQVLDWLCRTVDAGEGDSLIDDRSSATQSFKTHSDPAEWLDDIEITPSLIEPDSGEILKAEPSAEDDASVVFEVDSKLVFLVPNTVDMSRLLKLSARQERVSRVLAKGVSTKAGLADAQIDGVDQLVVGMLSSNLPKKGLADVLEIVRHLEVMDSQITFLLFGPQTSALQAVLDGQSADSGVRICSAGYVDDPAKALKLVDVVINVSRFQESFGRTVLEAMVAARPVVGYAWGALPELVVNEETGFLVPFGDTQAIAERLVRLAKDPDFITRMGRAGRQRAVACFSGSRLNGRLLQVYERFGLKVFS